MITIKKEKLAIVLKELLHLKYILNYYSPQTNEESNNQKETRKVDMSTANKSLQDIEKSLKKLNDHIEALQDNIDDENIYFLILHSKIGRDFNNILYIIELVYKKVYQIFEESYHQYIPKPTLGRRFSHNNLVGRLKEHYETMIRTLTKEDYSDGLILSWSYRNYIALEEKHNRFTNNNRDTYGAYISLPYWYYEIPTLLPSVAHECMRIALLKGSKVLTNVRSRFDSVVNQHLNTQRNDLSFTYEEKILEERYNLSSKVVADLAAYSIYGNAYLYSIFHDTIGVELSKLFELKDMEKQEEVVTSLDTRESSSLLEYIKDNFDSKISSIRFDPTRDISLIRLNVLLAYAKADSEKSTQDDDTFLEMENLLNAILLVYTDEKRSSKASELEKIFTNHEHYLGSFIVYKKAILNTIELYKKTATSVKVEISSIKVKSNTIDFNELWSAHLNNVIHKNELRKQLHKKTFDELDSLNRNITHKDEELGQPFSLTFVKILKDIKCDESEHERTICLDQEIDSCFKNSDYFHAFGIYDLAILKNTTDYHKDINNIIKEKFDNIEKLNARINTRYYESKFSLMQMYPTIKGSRDTKCNRVSILYNIDLKVSDIDTHTSLADSITKIAKKLNSKPGQFIEAKIFKTLGPGDLIVLIKGVPQDNFLYFTEEIIPLQCVKRTFTTILAAKGKKESIKPDRKYRTVSFIRLNLNKEQSLKDTVGSIYEDMKQNNISQYVDSIHFTSGVLDLEIIWKPGTSVQQIMNFYDALMTKKIVRDFQTKFNKIYPVDTNVMNVPLNPEPAR